MFAKKSISSILAVNDLYKSHRILRKHLTSFLVLFIAHYDLIYNKGVTGVYEILIMVKILKKTLKLCPEFILLTWQNMFTLITPDLNMNIENTFHNKLNKMNVVWMNLHSCHTFWENTTPLFKWKRKLGMILRARSESISEN